MVRTLVSFAVVSTVCVAALLTVISAIEDHHAFDPIPSPDGSLVLHPALNEDRRVSYSVTDRAGTKIAQVDSHASDNWRWALGWNTNDTIVLTSSDIGTSAWKIGAHGDITELPYLLPKELSLRGEELMQRKYPDRR